MGVSSSLKPLGSSSGGRSTTTHPRHSRRNPNRRRNGGGGDGGGGNGGGDDKDDNHHGSGGSGGKDRGEHGIPLIQVSCRDEWYPMEHCVTVGDVLTELKRRQPPGSSDPSTTPTTANNNKARWRMNLSPSSSQQQQQQQQNQNHRAKLIVRGKILEDPKSILKEQGVRNGDTILVVTENQPLKPHEALAMFLEMIAGENGGAPLAQLMEHWKEHDLGDYLLPLLLPDNIMDATQISQALRKAVDWGYHRLRSWWERPDFRMRLLQPELEIYRKVLKRHLPPTVQKELSPAAKQILQSPEAWQQQIGKAGQTILQFGDVVLDGLLDIVLDIVQGAAGRNKLPEDSLSGQFSRTSGSSSSSTYYEPFMEDPFMANQMLDELSESEDD